MKASVRKSFGRKSEQDVAKNLAATLARVREILRPGGVAVFSECVRPFEGQPIYVEFVFNFLENFTGVETDPETRPNHGFLTPGSWRRSLAAAGFAALRRVLRGRGQRAEAPLLTIMPLY